MQKILCSHGITPKCNCSECKRTYQKNYRLKHRHKHIAYMKEYNKKNKQKLKEYTKKYRVKHRNHTRKQRFLYGNKLKDGFLSSEGFCLNCSETNPFMLETEHPFGRKNNNFTITLCGSCHSLRHRLGYNVLKGLIEG